MRGDSFVKHGDFHVQGIFDNAKSPETTSILSGGPTTVYGSNLSHFIFQPRIGALRAGFFSSGVTPNTAQMGHYSVGLGRNPIAGGGGAIGVSAVAIGDSNQALDDFTVAIGKNNRLGAGNKNAIAIGTDNIVSSVLTGAEINADLSLFGHRNTIEGTTTGSPRAEMVQVLGVDNKVVSGTGVEKTMIYGIGNTVGGLNNSVRNGIVIGVDNLDSADNAIMLSKSSTTRVNATTSVNIGNFNEG